jgi:signal transduction histidine kinase
MRPLTETAAAGLPLAASLAMVIGQALRTSRRREALNRALHELRRPLQALCLSPPSPAAPAGGGSGTLDLAIAALARLDREINGGPGLPQRRLVIPRQLLTESVERWRSRASLAGGSLRLRWEAGRSAVIADPAAFAQALDNLIVNGLEHGGPDMTVQATSRSARLRIAVADSGRAARPPERLETPRETIARLTGRRRRGHGLDIVRRFAAEHDGRFVLEQGERGSVAILELPVAASGRLHAA